VTGQSPVEVTQIKANCSYMPILWEKALYRDNARMYNEYDLDFRSPGTEGDPAQGRDRMLRHKTVALTVLTLVAMVSAYPADIAGKWTADFDTAIEVQKYTYEFKVDGAKLTGKAIGKRVDSEAEVEIQEGKVNGDEISFIENLKFGDQDIRIEYKGKVSGDKIKFACKVGDFATKAFVAKRVR
jgi:hypothetical protein